MISLRETMARVLRMHQIQCTGLGEVTCAATTCRERGWMSWVDYHDHIADELVTHAQQYIPQTEGMSVSVDVSTGDHDANHRLFARVTGSQYDTQAGRTMLLAEAVEDNNDRQETVS